VGKNVARPHLNQEMLDMLAGTCLHSYTGSIRVYKEDCSPCQPKQRVRETITKIIKAKMNE
jgi:hypothetical protein